MDAIIVALITGGCSVVGVIITTLTTSRRTEQRMATAQAVTDTKIEELTREVREHNNSGIPPPIMYKKCRADRSTLPGDNKKRPGHTAQAIRYILLKNGASRQK